MINNVGLNNLYTERLDLKVPTMIEQHRLWQILIDNDVNQYYFPTPNRIFVKNNLDKTSIKDLKQAREIFIKELSNWDVQRPFYEQKIQSIQAGDDTQKFTWSIFLKNTDIVIGQIICQPIDNEHNAIRDVGWYIDPVYQGMGYATEAAVAMLDYMFNIVGITEIKTSAVEINSSSWRIMEKLGFEYQGLKKSTFFKDNQLLLSKNYYCNKDLFLGRTIKKKL